MEGSFQSIQSPVVLRLLTVRLFSQVVKTRVGWQEYTESIRKSPHLAANAAGENSRQDDRRRNRFPRLKLTPL